MSENKESYLYAIRLLAKRDYSIYKMQTKLSDKGFEQDQVDHTIQKLLDLNYLREEEYIRQRIRGLFYKSYSSHFIIKKLQQEQINVDFDYIDTLKKEWDLDERQIAIELILKKTRNLSLPVSDSFKLKTKIRRFLESKGFRSDEFITEIDQTLSPE